jgi:putative methyltransferase
VDDDGETTVAVSEADLKARLAALSSFQHTLLVHALRFPAARRVTYSTCSVHAEENEHVVLRALQSEVARERGWRILTRSEQVEGMKRWPVRGRVEFCGGQEGAEAVAEGCIRAHKGDGHRVMGFFVAALVRDERGIAERGGIKGGPGAGPMSHVATDDCRAGTQESGESDWGGFDD